MRISDWSTDVCSSDLYDARITPEYGLRPQMPANIPRQFATIDLRDGSTRPATADESSLLEPDSLSGLPGAPKIVGRHRSEEHTSELQSLMRISYTVFCLKKTKRTNCTLGTVHTTAHRVIDS